MRKLFGVAALVISSVLTACGGGGGSPGDTKLPYTITLTAAKTQLPINIADQGPGTGAYATYTTTLYVNAFKGGAAIQGGTDIFGCNISQGLDSGALYYLDGKTEHEVDVSDGKGGTIKVPGAYGSIVLDSNSGGNSFHFHAGTQAGTAHITCSVTNPADNQVSSASVDIVVGAATGKPASVIGSAQAPNYLGSQGNLSLIRNSVGIQAFIMDDANQPIPNPNSANVQISIRPFASAGDASAGARLLSGSQSGSVLQVRTIGGTGLISLSSGPNSGVILLEFTTDRFDNDVSNGIQDPVTSLLAVGVYDAISATPLSITATTLPGAQVGVPFAYALGASGGTPPYSWTATAGLPSGLTLGSSGVLQGTPSVAGSYNIVVTVTDSLGATSTQNMAITVAAAAVVTPPTPTTPAQAPLTITGCTGSATTVCQLPNATAGTLYLYAFSATGGDETKPVTWDFTPAAPAWLTTNQVGNNGVISGTPANPVAPGECSVNFLATATRDTISVSRQILVKVASGSGGCP